MLDKILPLPMLVVLALTTALTACGGGATPGAPTTTGSGQPSLPVPVPVQTPSTGAEAIVSPPADVSVSSIVQSVPAPTYSGASEELAAITLLNAERSRCGFGLLAQNTALGTSAKNHADYSLINNLAGHYETQLVPTGFTGLTPKDRAIAAGYNPLDAVEAYTAVMGEASTAGLGITSTRILMAAPYHLFGMMAPLKDVGISVRSVNSVAPLTANGMSSIAVYNFGVVASANFQTPDSSGVLTYPCNGVVGAQPSVKGESPNPVPGRNLAINPLGPGMLVMVQRGRILEITGASLINVATGVAVALRAPVTGSNDVNGLLSTYGKYMGFVVPDAPLAPNSSYQAVISGTNGGTPFSRTFTFATGTDLQ